MQELDALRVAEDAARVAGEVLESWAERFTAREKSPANLVTEADLAAQEAIARVLRGAFPEYGFLGEEGPPEVPSNSPHRWIVDPLDGTSNYVHRFPFYAVSIALESHGELRVGVIFDPNRNEMFTAVRGQGARMNGKTLSTTSTGTLREAMLVASLPVATRPDDPAVARFLRVLPHAQTVQRTGSAALNLAYVAAGRLDGYWSSSLKPWDQAAGVLLATEAGGRVTTMDGCSFDVNRPNLLATNGTAIHGALAELLA